MKLIPLTKGQFAKVSDHRFDEFSKHNWSARWSEDTQSFYALRKEQGRIIIMHREIMKTPKGMICDHRNHDTLDNQDENLRNVTHSESLMNRRAFSNNKLGEKNIYRLGKLFYVSITRNDKIVFQEGYKTIEEAKTARGEALKVHHGDFSGLV